MLVQQGLIYYGPAKKDLSLILALPYLTLLAHAAQRIGNVITSRWRIQMHKLNNWRAGRAGMCSGSELSAARSARATTSYMLPAHRERLISYHSTWQIRPPWRGGRRCALVDGQALGSFRPAVDYSGGGLWSLLLQVADLQIRIRARGAGRGARSAAEQAEQTADAANARPGQALRIMPGACDRRLPARPAALC